MKTKLAILFFFTFFLSISQTNFRPEISITYEMMLYDQIYKAQLLFNDNFSYFFYSPAHLDKSNEYEKKSKDEFGNINLDYQIVVKDTLQHYIFIDKKNNSLYFNALNPLQKKSIMVTEKIPSLQWKIQAQTKKVGDYIVQKATASFRGRDYTAWFAKDLPGFFGPMKFGRLPGLILIIFDDTKEVIIKAKQISSYKGEVISIEIPEDPVNRKEFLAIKKQYTKELGEKLKAAFLRLGSGAKVSNLKIKNKEQGIEIDN